MSLDDLAHGPLLGAAYVVLAAAVAMRLAFFTVAILRSRRGSDFAPGYVATVFGRALFPFHMGALRKPFYAVLRYVFHVCLLVVPIGLEAHISLREDSWFDVTWPGLPDAWADWLTLCVIGIAAVFLIRRLFVPQVRQDSSLADYALILVVALPFITGYLSAQGSLDEIHFFRNHLETIHTLSGELFMVVAAVLLCGTRLSAKRCIGCEACEIACPTRALVSKDEGRFRAFSYLHYRCISCGSCVKVCPEDAVELRHEIGFVKLFQLLSKRKILAVPLSECSECGALFAPEPQLHRIGQKIADGNYLVCPRCRVNSYVELVGRTVAAPSVRRTFPD